MCVCSTPGDDNLKFGGIGDDSDSDGDQALLLAGIQPGTATDPAQAHKNKNSKRKPPFNKSEADYAAKVKAKSMAKASLIKKQAKLIKELQAFVLASAERASRRVRSFHLTMTRVGGRPHLSRVQIKRPPPPASCSRSVAPSPCRLTRSFAPARAASRRLPRRWR
jgi:hypothetical protein